MTYVPANIEKLKKLLNDLDERDALIRELVDALDAAKLELILDAKYPSKDLPIIEKLIEKSQQIVGKV